MKLQKRTITLLVVLFALTGFSTIQAQLFSAMPDNYYIGKGKNKSLFVLNNDNLGLCGEDPSTLNLRISVPPSNALACQVDPSGFGIQYRANANFVGQHELKYTITCNGIDSETTVYINVGDKPDYISEKECTILPDAFQWRITKVAQTDIGLTNIGKIAGVLAADIDGDGITEIITAKTTAATPNWSNMLSVFNTDLEEINTINLGDYYIESSNGFAVSFAVAKVDVNGELKTLIIVETHIRQQNGRPATGEKRLHAYTHEKPNGTNGSNGAYTKVWTAIVDSGYKDEVAGNYSTAEVHVADIDGDGFSEVIVGGRIFAAENGNCLATLPPGGRGVVAGYV